MKLSISRKIKIFPFINEQIVEITHNEDKQLGPYFLSNIQDGSLLSPTIFKSKILYYLWEILPSHERMSLFNETYGTFRRWWALVHKSIE